MLVHPYWEQFKPLEKYAHSIAIIVFVIIMVIGGLGNLMIILFHLRFERVRRSTTFLMINLALADLFFIISNLPLAIYNCMNGRWMFDKVGCNIYGFCGALCGFASIGTMVLISVERLLVLKCPFKNISSNKKFIIGAIASSWLYGLIWTILPFFGPNNYITEGFQTSCSFDYISQDIYTRLILMIMTVFGFVLPILIISISYLMIVSSIRAHYNSLQMRIFKSQRINRDSSVRRQSMQLKSKNEIKSEIDYPCSEITHSLMQQFQNDVRAHSFEMKINTRTSNDSRFYNSINLPKTCRSYQNVYIIPSSDTSRQTNKISFFKNEIKLTKFTMLIIMTFCLSWMPYATISMIGQFATNREKYITPNTTYTATILAKCSTLFNPFIYLLINQRFKAKFWLVFLTLLGKGNN